MANGIINWQSDPAALADLIEWLGKGPDGEMSSPDVLYLLRKPHKWSSEYAAMMAAKSTPVELTGSDQ